MMASWNNAGVVGYYVVITGDDRGSYLRTDDLSNHSAVEREDATLFAERAKAMGRAAHWMECFPATSARLCVVTRRWRQKGVRRG